MHETFPGFEIEYTAAHQHAVLADLSTRGKIRVTGADRILVLHRLLTNDIRSLPENGSCHAAFLNAQGKVLGDMQVLRLRDEVLLDVEAGLEAKLVEALNRFIITEDVILTPAGQQTGHAAVWGPAAEKMLAEAYGMPPGTVKAQEISERGSGVWIFNKPSGKTAWWEILMPAQSLEKETTRLLDLGICPAGEETWETLRIEAGVLRYGRDMDETVTLPETLLDSIAASDTKGCYPGQEVVARTNTYKGHTKKMTRMEWKGQKVPAAGEKIYSGENEAGWITSACTLPSRDRGFALGYLLKPYFQLKGPFHSVSATLTAPA